MKKWILFGLSFIGLIVLTTLLMSGWFERNPAAGIIVMLGLGFSVMAAIAAAMFYLGASWTERQVRLGASIATTAQQIDHTADGHKVVALAQMARFAFQAGQKSRRADSLAPAQPLPILPPPTTSEGTSAWLPPLTNFREEFTGHPRLDLAEPD